MSPYIRVGPDGTVWLAGADLRVVRSVDGGRAWSEVRHDLDLDFGSSLSYTTFRQPVRYAFAPSSVDAETLYLVTRTAEGGETGLWIRVSHDGASTWSEPVRVDDGNEGDAFGPMIAVASDDRVAVAFFDRRLACPLADTVEAVAAGLEWDPGTDAAPGSPVGKAGYCVNVAMARWTDDLAPIGTNLRLTPASWDPQLSAPRPDGIEGGVTFIGDYFGIAVTDDAIYTATPSTLNFDGENPFFHQQQWVARVGWEPR